MKNDLLTTTMRLAVNSTLPVTQVCRSIGVTTRWYQKLMSGQIKDPSVRRIQRLHDYLATEAEKRSAA